MVLDPTDRIWISRCFQPSVLSKTASSTIFYLWVWKMTVFLLENPEILSTPRWLYMHVYVDTCLHLCRYTWTAKVLKTMACSATCKDLWAIVFGCFLVLWRSGYRCVSNPPLLYRLPTCSIRSYKDERVQILHL